MASRALARVVDMAGPRSLLPGAVVALGFQGLLFQALVGVSVVRRAPFPAMEEV